MITNMRSNEFKFHLYVFFSTFARNLIEVFIPIILLKTGFSFKEVIFYFFITNFFALLISYPAALVSKRYSNRLIALISMISFFLLQIVLNFISVHIWYLIGIALLFALYKQLYWMSRRFYNFKVLRGHEIAKKYSIISVINQLGVVVSAYIGSLILDYVSVTILTIISIFIFLVSIVILYTLKFDHEKNYEEIQLIRTIKLIPKQNLFHFGCFELLNVIKFLFAIYIFIYIKDNYQTIGIVNVATNASIMLFSYFYGKYIDKKRNLLKSSILLVVLVYILKANCVNYLIIFISFLEGIVFKMYEISLNSNLYKLAKKYEYYNYNLVYEIVLNVFRTIVMFILYIFNLDLRTMIFLTLFVISTGMFVPFVDVDRKNYKLIDK